MPTKHRYWAVHYGFFDLLAVGYLAYGVNVHGEDWYLWHEYLHDTLTLIYY